MKTQVKILITLLSTVLLTASVNADAKIDDGYKKQCKYVVYGKGNDSSYYAEVMAGIPEEIRASLSAKDTTAFSKHTTRTTMQLKACKYALHHISLDGFENDYKMAVQKLITSK